MVLKCLLQESNNNLSFNDRYTKKSDIFNLKHTFFHIYEITVKTQEGVSFFLLCPNLNKNTSELIRNLHVHLNKTKVQFYDEDSQIICIPILSEDKTYPHLRFPLSRNNLNTFAKLGLILRRILFYFS